MLYNIVKDVRGVGEGDWGKLLSHLLREMWIEISKAFFIKKFISSHLLREMWIEIDIKFLQSLCKAESSPAGDVDLLREMWIE
ncbi:hypothetical protein DXA14_24275, partial [Hungatella hathewayi]